MIDQQNEQGVQGVSAASQPEGGQAPVAAGAPEAGALFGQTEAEALDAMFQVSGMEYISERHVACVFLLDCSDSMNVNDAIGKLNQGIRDFKAQIAGDPAFDTQTKACIDVAFVGFSTQARKLSGFMPASRMETPTLEASGLTSLGAAINLGLDMIQEQKNRYNANGTPYYRPWLFCITDGLPTDDTEAAAARLKELEANKKVLGYCVGVDGYDKDEMAKIFDKSRIFELSGLDFSGLFQFVSSSLSAARNSGEASGGTVQVTAPTTMTMAF